MNLVPHCKYFAFGLYKSFNPLELILQNLVYVGHRSYQVVMTIRNRVPGAILLACMLVISSLAIVSSVQGMPTERPRADRVVGDMGELVGSFRTIALENLITFLQFLSDGGILFEGGGHGQVNLDRSGSGDADGGGHGHDTRFKTLLSSSVSPICSVGSTCTWTATTPDR